MAETKNPIGRPPKFKTVEELEDKISEYFLSCEGIEEEENKSPTKAGLALYLDTTRETLGDYEEKDGFSYAIKRAYLIIEEYWASSLINRKFDSTGAIFYLKNAYSKEYRDKREYDHTTKGEAITGFNYVKPE